MSDTVSENIKYKWTPESTALLVSVWSDRQVQKQLEYALRPQVIWESVARYMRKKGYNVSAKQCRSRMKQLLVCYREAKRAGTRHGLEQYYETLDRVLKNKRWEQQANINGLDTVDATVNIKSPPKDVKTNKNLQMRLKVQEPVQCLYRTDALSPTWAIGHENEYPDSPESNETIIAKPYRVFSPTRDVAINTGERLIQMGNRGVQANLVTAEEPIREDYRQNLLAHFPYGEVPYQNTVQNVQNQIIQENMQYQQNRGWNQLPRQNGALMNDYGFQQNVNHMNQRLSNGMMQGNNITQNINAENFARQQNQLQHDADNRAMPQEPRKILFAQNLQADRPYKQYRDTIPRPVCMANIKQNIESPDYSPDVSQNLNDAFCLSKSNEKTHNLNETYNQPITHLDNPILVHNADATVVTNNATCNDDSLLFEFLIDSPTPSENNGKLKNTAVNTDDIPSVPFRKKKAQKLEQLVLGAINSQNEVVNKFLAAQNDMVMRFLDVNKDRQNRLEDRLEDLLHVVRATVLNKERETFSSPSSELAITSLLPPPKPGMVPPKLDLVPPKPCRVPCTLPNSNIQLINQNPILTRPGVVSPINSPDKRKLGTIWSKLGPVSQSPFVKAQQRLGFQRISLNSDARTQSSAERRIARELNSPMMNTCYLICETAKLLEMERQLEEKIENARLEVAMSQTLTARKRLFTQREPTPIMILTAAFLDTECRIYEQDPPYHGTWEMRKKRFIQDNILAGRGESYERMRHLNAARNDFDCEPCDSSTPAKFQFRNPNVRDEITTEVPKQTIQQLARLVMNSARWRDSTVHNPRQNSGRPTATAQSVNNQSIDIEYNATFTAPKANAPPYVPELQSRDVMKNYEMQRRQSIHNKPAFNNGLVEGDSCGQTKHPIGFTTAMLVANEQKETGTSRQVNGGAPRSSIFVDNQLTDRKNNVRFLDEALAELQRMYIERQTATENAGDTMSVVKTGNGNSAMNTHNRNMIERYVNDLISKKSTREKDTDSDNDDEYLDTTTNMHPTCMVSRRSSLTSNGTSSTNSLKSSKAAVNHCRIS